MAKEKEIKTNAMRILDRQKIKYEVLQYECDEFIDGLHTAEKTGAPVEQSFKTLVAQGKSKTDSQYKPYRNGCTWKIDDRNSDDGKYV